MNNKKILFLCVVLLLGGCADVQNFGTSLKYNIQGEYLLQEKNFDKGSETFRKAAESDPDNAEARFYYGRFLLAGNQAAKALPQLRQAAALDPGRSDYHFWLGIAHGELGREANERKSYRQALKIDPDSTQALTYLGNNLLRAGHNLEALALYSRALELYHWNPQALYNRAIILRKLNRRPEERLAWLQYLDAYPAGNFARLAADRLNTLDDNTYRNHRLGLRTVTLTAIDFEPFTAKLTADAQASLDLVGASVTNMPKGALNIIVHQLNNRQLAKERAISIRDYLERKYPQLQNDKRIRLSWFDVAEKRTVLGKSLQVEESVLFFLSDMERKKKSHEKK